MSSSKGELYLLPTPIAGNDPTRVLPTRAIDAVLGIRHFICETPRTARRWLKELPLEHPLEELHFHPIGKKSDPSEFPSYLTPCEEGENMALLSDAGCPGVADPGAEIVSLAHRKGIQVHPLIGPSSILQTLMASGLNGQSFRFHGYAPYDEKALKRLIVSMQKDAEKGETQMIMETPYRNGRLLQAFLEHGDPRASLCIAVEIGNEGGYVRTRSLAEWGQEAPDLHKRPAVFAFGY